MTEAVMIGHKKDNSNFIWIFKDQITNLYAFEIGVNHNTELNYPYGKGFILDDNKINVIIKEYELLGWSINMSNNNPN